MNFILTILNDVEKSRISSVLTISSEVFKEILSGFSMVYLSTMENYSTSVNKLFLLNKPFSLLLFHQLLSLIECLTDKLRNAGHVPTRHYFVRFHGVYLFSPVATHGQFANICFILYYHNKLEKFIIKEHMELVCTMLSPVIHVLAWLRDRNFIPLKVAALIYLCHVTIIIAVWSNA